MLFCTCWSGFQSVVVVTTRHIRSKVDGSRILGLSGAMKSTKMAALDGHPDLQRVAVQSGHLCHYIYIIIISSANALGTDRFQVVGDRFDLI